MTFKFFSKEITVKVRQYDPMNQWRIVPQKEHLSLREWAEEGRREFLSHFKPGDWKIPQVRADITKVLHWFHRHEREQVFLD